jgi:hypothetical protein
MGRKRGRVTALGGCTDSTSGCNVRMYGTTRATQHGYSIYELQVHAI